MTILTLPESADVSRVDWELQRNDVMSGVQALRAADPLWRVSLEFSPDMDANSGYLKALLMRLRGGSKRLELHNHSRPEPTGTYRGTLSLASGVAAGDTSMSIVAENNNLLVDPEALNAGSWGKASMMPLAAGSVLAPDGTNSMETLVPNTSNAEHYARQRPTGIPADAVLTFSFHVSAAGYSHARLRALDGNAVANGFLGTFDFSNLTYSAAKASAGTLIEAGISEAENGSRRIHVTGKLGNASTTEVICDLYPALSTTGSVVFAGDGVSGINAWGGKVELGSLTDYGYGKTLRKGDLLGIGSGTTQQVVMVTEDAVSTSQGNITVQFQPPLRNAFSAGQAVVWDKPTALFRRVSNEMGWEYRGKNPITSGVALDLIEDWRE